MTERIAPPLSAAADAARRARLVGAASELGLALTPPAVDRLIAYLDLLRRWNRVYNLTALRGPDEILSHHLLDCLAALPALERHAAGRPLRILDVGSGAGLPGVVLAVTHPDWRIACVDAVAKKAGFVRQVASELALPNLNSVHSRVEAMPDGMQFDVVVSRAFASLADFVRLAQGRLAPGGVWLAMKGKPPDDEITELPAGIDVFHVEQLQVPGLDAQRCLVWLHPHGAA
jgi:16S rRNA (guanine527-N7)-methyltransferase